MDAAINLVLVAHHPHDGDVLAGPVLLFENLEAVDLAPLDAATVGLAGLDWLAVELAQELVFLSALERGGGARVQVQRGAVVVNVEVFGNADGLLVHPLGQRHIAHAQRLQGVGRRSVGVQTVVLVLGDVLGDEAPLGVRAARVLDQRVHVDRETVPNAPDLDVLVETGVVAVFGQDADVALAVGHLVLAGGVVGHVGVRDVLDMAHHAVKYLCHFYVSIVVHRDDLAAGPVLPLVVGDLTNVLGQFVDGQAGAGVDRLPLDSATGGQHVGGPLPLVVGGTGVETQVV